MIWKDHNCSLPSFPLTLESNKTIPYITSGPLSTYCVQYILYIWGLWFLPSTFVWTTCTGCFKSNCMKIILRSQVDIALFTAGHQQRVTMRRRSSSWSCHPPCLMCTETKVVFPWNVSIMLIKQPYDTCCYNYQTCWLVYIKSCSQHILTVLLYAEYHHHHQHIPPPVTPFPRCQSALFTTVQIVSL